MPLVIGVDSSASGTRVVVRDVDDGTLVASGHAALPTAARPSNRQDPRDWWETMVAAVSAAGARRVAALAVAAQPHGLVLLDQAGSVLAPASVGLDEDAAPEAARMVERVGAPRWARASGSVPDARFAVAKLAWLARSEPQTYERVAAVLAPHDFLTHRLTGRLVTDRGDASTTGFWSPGDDAWRAELLERTVGRLKTGSWSDRLPEVIGPGEPSDYVSASQNHQLGLRGRPLCGPGTARTMAAALGCGLQLGDAMIVLDDDGGVSAVTERPTTDASGAVAGYADATGRFLPTVGPRVTTDVTDTMARILGVEMAELDLLALSAKPGAGGIVVLPESPGRLVGLGSEATREQVARAAFEGVACDLLDGLDALRAAGAAADDRLVLVGRGASSAAFRRTLADLSGLEVSVPAVDSPVATGAAVQAAAVLVGAEPQEVIEAWRLGEGSVVEPAGELDRSAVRRAYRRARGERSKIPKGIENH